MPSDAVLRQQLLERAYDVQADRRGKGVKEVLDLVPLAEVTRQR